MSIESQSTCIEIKYTIVVVVDEKRNVWCCVEHGCMYVQTIYCSFKIVHSCWLFHIQPLTLVYFILQIILCSQRIFSLKI